MFEEVDDELLDELEEEVVLDDEERLFLLDAGELAHEEHADEIAFCSRESFVFSRLLFAIKSAISFAFMLSIRFWAC